MTDLQTYLDFAQETAWEAGRLTLGYYQTNLRPDFKADESPVTVADREAEKLIRARIEEKFPHHAIMGEEFGDSGKTSSHRWIIDPIDGTRSFVRGVPLYGVLIGLEIEGKCEVGVANFPALSEVVAAATGLGCWWNGRRARVSAVERLEQALVTHFDVAAFEKSGKQAVLDKLKKTANYRVGWCDAYGYLLVATGRSDLMLDPVMNPWDCAPFPPILSEAGGYFGDWRGNVTIYAGEALGTSQQLLAQVLEITNQLEG